MGSINLWKLEILSSSVILINMINQKLKIAFLNKQLPSDKPNGVSVQVHRLANELSIRGHSVICISFSPKPIDALYQHKKLKTMFSSLLLKKFEAAIQFSKIKSSDYDIIHYHGDDFLCKGSKNRVRTFYGSALNEALHAKNLKKILYQSLFYLFELSSLFKKGYKVGISKATKSVLPFINTVINCGVPEKIFKVKDIKTKNPSILFIGDLHSRKRGSFLLKLFEEEILPQYPNCTLTVVGPEECNGKNIKYLGKIEDKQLISEYQKSWIYCMPSSYEGFGVPAIEAMACNTIVITTKNAATNELIVNNRNGIISNTKKFGSDILKVIGDNNLQNRIRKEGLNTFKQRFTIKYTADSYENIYNLILKNKNER